MTVPAPIWRVIDRPQAKMRATCLPKDAEETSALRIVRDTLTSRPHMPRVPA